MLLLCGALPRVFHIGIDLSSIHLSRRVSDFARVACIVNQAMLALRKTLLECVHMMP